jgi:hypothetical protein
MTGRSGMNMMSFGSNHAVECIEYCATSVILALAHSCGGDDGDFSYSNLALLLMVAISDFFVMMMNN